MWVGLEGLEGLETLINMQLVTVGYLISILLCAFHVRIVIWSMKREKDIKNVLRKEVLALFCII